MTATQPPAGKSPLRQERVIAVLVLVAILAALLFWWSLKAEVAGPAQPISFSHRFHVSTKGLSCFMCHPGAANSPRAGVPPMETCMLCHTRIITEHPEIVKLRGHYDRRDPVQWVRVNDVPDFVYFDHSIHLHRGIDCGRCHGDVAQMDRVSMAFDLKMGFCVQCHRDNGVTHDCLACHR